MASFRRKTMFGFANRNWKPWKLYDDLEVLVSGDFNTTIDANGDTLIYPRRRHLRSAERADAQGRALLRRHRAPAAHR